MVKNRRQAEIHAARDASWKPRGNYDNFAVSGRLETMWNRVNRKRKKIILGVLTIVIGLTPCLLLFESGGGGWTRTNDLRIMRPSL